MELPQIRGLGVFDTLEGVRVVKRSEEISNATWAESETIEGAVVWFNPKRGGVRVCNRASAITLGENQDARKLIGEIDGAFERRGLRCWELSSAEADWSPEVSAAAREAGYREGGRWLYQLRHYRGVESVRKDVQILPARAAYGALGEVFRDMGAQGPHETGEDVEGFVATMIDRLDEPRLEVFLGRVEGRSVGVAGVMSLGPVGVVASVHTMRDFRGRGVGGTMLGHVMDYCQRAQFEQVILQTPAGCPAGRLYQRVGFERVREFVVYEREG
ncbi:MAG: GNAT family N-acetyltransferase [Phycisphaeraceae bacterium]|nr:GNAT family N-acetyltransferase [Phycisphaeraceae bacterium]